MCGVLALISIKMTKSDEVRIKEMEEKYGKTSLPQNNEKMQLFLNDVRFRTHVACHRG